MTAIMESLTNIDYKIIHSLPGRIRISVPKIKNNWEYAAQLEESLNSLDFVVRVRLNHTASSVAIRYQVGELSNQVVVEKITNCFEELTSTNLQQDNDKYFLEKKAEDNFEDNIAIAKFSGELVGEVVGEVIGHALLGSLGASVVSGVMGKAGEMLGETVSHEIDDVVGLIEHLENQVTGNQNKLLQKNTKFIPKKELKKSTITGLSISQLSILWQIPSRIISNQAEQGVTAFENWTLGRYGAAWTFVLSDPTNSKSEKLFFPKG